MTRSRKKTSSSSIDMDPESSTFSSITSISTSFSFTSSLPPGPSGLPVVGSALEYKGPQTNLKWAELYGPIYHVRMGDKSLVYLNTIELVEKYMEGRSGEQFLGRPMGPAAVGEGLLFGNGEHWKSNKRAFMRAMHTMTLLDDMEVAVQSELALALEDLHKRAVRGRPTRVGDALLPACANVVSGFLLGGSLPRNCPERESLHRIMKNLEGVDLTSKLTQITLKYPKMTKPLKKLTFKDIVDVHAISRRLQRLVRQWIRQTRSGAMYENQASCYQPLSPPGQCPFAAHARIAGSSEQNSAATGSNNNNNNELSLNIPSRHFPSAENSTTDTSSSSGDTQQSSGGPQHAADIPEIQTPEIQPPTPATPTNPPTEEDIAGLQHREEDDEDSVDSDDLLETPSTPSNMTRHFISTESLLTLPKDASRVEDIIENEAHLASLGFSPVAPGEQPFEPVEEPALLDTPDCPRTPITEFQWQFGREMSVNEAHHSILQRILAQPEFAGVTEENDEELLQSLLDMFFGGVTTVVSGLEFVLMYLSKNPTMQLLAQQEIARVVAEEAGSGGGVTWSMREKMPYVRACVVEALRLAGVTPSSLPHVATADAEIEDFIIPKNTFVLASIYSMHRDPKEYLDAHEFRPQRHIDDEGNFCQPRSYRPFGVGARRCVGETLAEMELFLFTSAILREFNLVSPPGSKKASAMETHMRIVHRLKDFKCILQKRK